MRLRSVEEVKNFRDSVSEVYVTAVLSEVRLGSVIGEVSLRGEDYKLSSGAVYRICRVLGVPYSFMEEKPKERIERARKRWFRKRINEKASLNKSMKGRQNTRRPILFSNTWNHNNC